MTPRQYWQEMKTKAAENLHIVSGYPIPQNENEVKNIVHTALRVGTYAQAACTIIEADEWAIAHLNLECLNKCGM